MNTATHTPTPWKLHARAGTAIEGATGFVVAACGGYSTNTRDPEELASELGANAAFIVRACNAHDELVAALKEIARTDRGQKVTAADLADIARGALARAGA